MILIIWPLVIGITMVLYSLIIISLPFSTVMATIFLLALIGYWSRLPGVGIPHPFYILYIADVIDIFSLLIAVNIGGVYGAIFSLFCNIMSRASGGWPEWGPVLSDSFSQAIVCLIIPFFHQAFGGNILISMVIFSILRIIFVIPFDQLGFYPIPFTQYVIELATGGLALFLINMFYTATFGNFFNNLLQQGVHFNWILFLFATAVIVIFYIAIAGMPNKAPSLRKMLKVLLHKKKKQKHELPKTEMKPLERVYEKK